MNGSDERESDGAHQRESEQRPCEQVRESEPKGSSYEKVDTNSLAALLELHR